MGNELKIIDAAIEYAYDFFTTDVVQALKEKYKVLNGNLFDSLNLSDAQDWTTKDKNLLTEFLKNNEENKDLFVKSYNLSEKKYKEKRNSLLKKLNTYKNYLNMYPYNKDKELANDIYKKIIESSLGLNNKFNFNILNESFKQFTDIDTIKNLIKELDNPTNTNNSLVINSNKLVKEMEDKKCTILSSGAMLIASASAISTVGFSLNFVGVVTLFGAYAACEKIMQKIVKNESKKLVKFTDIKKLNDEFKAKDIVARDLSNNFIYNKQYDPIKDKDDILFFCFLNEKLHEVKRQGDEGYGNILEEKIVKIPKELEESLTESQKNRLNNLTFEEIQKISTIKNNSLRKILILNELTPRNLNALKLIDSNLIISNNSKFDFSIDLDFAKLPQKVVEFFYDDSSNNKVEKEILKSYLLSNYKTDTKQFNNNAIENLIAGKEINFEKIFHNIENDFDCYKVEFDELKEKNILKKIIDGTLFKDVKEFFKKEGLKKMNFDMLKDIEKASKNNNYSETIKFLDKMPMLINDVVPNLTTKVLNKISQFRGNGQNNSPNISI